MKLADEGPSLWASGITILLFLFMLAMYPNRLKEQRTRVGNKQLKEKSEMFRNLITRTETIEISRLSSILEMDETTLMQWLLTLPANYGFTIKQNIIDFDSQSINDNIDALMNEFMSMEHGSGKI